ncbi:MAG: MT-A70 family methyltransferase [Dehalococcoidales bacterium]|nr:MT-A70 family methyltransferase [Dehalococcoidales bacterium]
MRYKSPGERPKRFRINPEFKNLISPLTPEEYAGLEKSIIEEGCRDPLSVWGDTIVDGHNRYEICHRHNIPFDFHVLKFPLPEDAIAWIINNQLARRNLTPEQRNYLIGKQYEERKKQVGRPAKLPQSEGISETAEIMATEHKIGRATVERAAAFSRAVDAIAENVGVDARQKILGRETKLTAKDIHRVAAMEPEKQKEVLDKVFTGAATSVVDARRLLRKEEVKEAPPLEGKYRVIYADPPWKYGDERDGSTTGATDHYPTMSIAELCDLPVADIAEDNAVLFLWTTSPLLEDSFKVINAWGFRYKSSFVWDKIKHNMGHYNSVRHEFLLICTRGSCTPDVVKLYDSVQAIERTEHSKKPEEFRAIIDTLYTHGNKIELFARQPADGWEVWGNVPAVI